VYLPDPDLAGLGLDAAAASDLNYFLWHLSKKIQCSA